MIPSPLQQLVASVEAFLTKWPDVEQRINGMFGLQFARSGVQYDGPNIGAEIEAMKAALAAAEREPQGWQPISSAPKEGRFIVYSPERSVFVVDGKFYSEATRPGTPKHLSMSMSRIGWRFLRLLPRL